MFSLLNIIKASLTFNLRSMAFKKKKKKDKIPHKLWKIEERQEREKEFDRDI